jgi:hypothetical protein
MASMKDDSRIAGAARVVLVLSAVAALAACGRGGKEAEKAAAKPAESPPAAVVEEKPSPPPADQGFARAVEDAKATATSGKTAAAVDLQYDVLAKPEPGQPFEIELAFVPRLPADALEVEVAAIPGIAVVSGGTARFQNVTPATRYATRVLARAEAPGLYYLGVVARMVTQVQTEARAFSVPVVVGAEPAVAKPQPAVDAAGQPVQSMPAEETTGKPDPAKQPD